jgi:hypothetical protein
MVHQRRTSHVGLLGECKGLHSKNTGTITHPLGSRPRVCQ